MKATLVLAANVVLSLVGLRVGLADECHNICADVQNGVHVKSGCSAFRNALPRPKVRRPRSSPDEVAQNANIISDMLFVLRSCRECPGHVVKGRMGLFPHRLRCFRTHKRRRPHLCAGFEHMPVRLQGGGRFELLRRVRQWRISAAVYFGKSVEGGVQQRPERDSKAALP